jgi:hypothetical protein
MSEPATPEPTPGTNPGWPARKVSLEAYFRANRTTTTEEALSAAARSSGHADEAIAAAWAKVRAEDAVGPIRDRARRIVLWAYAGTFFLLMAGMAVNNPTALGMGGGILLVCLLVGFGLSRFMVGAANPSATLGIMLAGPVILLLVVAGLCVGTGLPVAPFRI